MFARAIAIAVLVAAFPAASRAAPSDAPAAPADEFHAARPAGPSEFGTGAQEGPFLRRLFAPERMTPFILPAVVLAGVLIRFAELRTLRGLFLVASVVFLGFLMGPCPCSISGAQCVFLKAIGGEECRPGGFILFLALLPATYLFGRVWCGWICHLGALQEFIHLPGRRTFGTSLRVRTILRVVSIVCVAGLAVQLAVTKTNLYCQIEPFKTAFSLDSPFVWGWVLLGVALVASLYVNRPFCRTVCPVGVLLGWVSLIPGARVLEKGTTCNACGRCRRVCPTVAIREDMSVRHPECLMCGKCLDMCRTDGIRFSRRGRKGRTASHE
jgi:NAD-dependent dihydropyrimidine dehydrogenase PreA subunit